jgi:hypothetical protein
MTDTTTVPARLPRKGLQSGVVTEYTFIGHVQPGHEAEMRRDLLAHLNDPRRAGPELMRKVGIHASLHALFDNDTRFVGTVWFENSFDKYFDDVFTMIGPELYESFFRHAVGFPEEGILGGLSGQAGMEFAKNFLAVNHSDVASFRITITNLTLAEQEKAQRVMAAFQEVLDHPEAEQALKHPALKPLLAEAAD